MKQTIGLVLRDWRKQKHYSQLRLALDLGISSKHISFMETGRSIPSREMITRIGNFLSIPKQEINYGMRVAGYANAYPNLKINSRELKPIVSAINLMIDNHMPYPALVLNQFWDVVNLNASAKHILTKIGYENFDNLLDAIACDHPPTSKVLNWYESVQAILPRLRQEIIINGGSKKLEDLESKLLNQIDKLTQSRNATANEVFNTTKLLIDGNTLEFVSIMANLGTIKDINVGEYRIELMFPVDDKTKNYFNSIKV